MRVALVGASDQSATYAAGPDRPGIAYADLRSGPRGRLARGRGGRTGTGRDAVLVTPHWGPNMVIIRGGGPRGRRKRSWLRAPARGRTLRARLPRRPRPRAVRPRRLRRRLRRRSRAAQRPRIAVAHRARRPRATPTEAVPLKLERGHTRLATGEDAEEWIRRRFTHACAQLGTTVTEHEGRLLALIHEAASRHG